MKTSTLLALALTAFIVGCATKPRQSSHPGTTRIAVSGANGAAFTAFYVQDGRRISISNAVPYSLEVQRLSSLMIWKTHPAEEIVVDLGYESDTSRTHIMKPLPSGVVGIRVEVRDGLTATTF